LERLEKKNTKRSGKSSKIRILRGLERYGKKEYQEDWKVKENKNTKRIWKSRKIRLPRGLENKGI
jgi:serine/threonine-protein kinase RIO1